MLKLCLLVAALAACSSSEVSRELGAQCNDKSECDNRCLSGPEFPDGLCTNSCEKDLDCSSSTACIDKEGGVCLYRCSSAAECEFLGAGWKCDTKDLREFDGQEVSVCIGD